MTVRFAQWTLDVQDVALMVAFWSKALGFDIRYDDDGSAKLYPPSDAPPDVPTLWLQNTGEPKHGKNRYHPDLRPDEGGVDRDGPDISVACPARGPRPRRVVRLSHGYASDPGVHHDVITTSVEQEALPLTAEQGVRTTPTPQAAAWSTAAYRRAADYLSVAMIHLRDNVFLTEPLQPEHLKPRLLGHWGTCPGITYLYAGLNRLIPPDRTSLPAHHRARPRRRPPRPEPRSPAVPVRPRTRSGATVSEAAHGL